MTARFAFRVGRLPLPHRLLRFFGYGITRHVGTPPGAISAPSRPPLRSALRYRTDSGQGLRRDAGLDVLFTLLREKAEPIRTPLLLAVGVWDG